jgi:hypothetical protein
MDGPWPQVAGFLFLVALPMSMVGSTWAALAAGWLPDEVDQPVVFRFIAARSKGWATAGASNRGGMVFGLLFWGFANAEPLGLLLVWPYGLVGRAIVVAYAVVQGIWLLAIRRAIVRARSRD